MNYRKALSLSTLLLLSCYHTHAEFSLKSWFGRNKSDTFDKEFSFSPRGTVTIENITGPILVKTWTQDKIAITAIKEAREEDIDSIAIDVDIQGDNATIKTVYPDQPKFKGLVRYTIMIPDYSKLKVTTQQGDIKIKQVKGALFADTQSGLIDIQEAENSVTAQTTSGQLRLNYKRLPLNSVVTLSSTSGMITLSLPASTQAFIQADTENGIITSEQEITLKPRTVKLNNQTWKQFKREARGTIGNGGSKIKIISKSGNIKLLEY